jgi:hypothetical protein
MSRLLLLLSLIGAAIYGLLIYTHDVLTDEKAEKTYAGQQTEPNQHLSSWDGYLPDRSSNQNPQLAASLPTQMPSRQSDEPSQKLERNADQVAASENTATSSESYDTEPEPVELAKVVLAAQTHSQASVSSPLVRFYRPGTELQIVRREGIWLQVSDPVTQESGWVLAQYLSSIESPTPIQVATESTTEPPTVISPKSSKRHRSARHAAHGVGLANADPLNARWARRADRRRGFGLFMFRPLPRFAQR